MVPAAENVSAATVMLVDEVTRGKVLVHQQRLKGLSLVGLIDVSFDQQGVFSGQFPISTEPSMPHQPVVASFLVLCVTKPSICEIPAESPVIALLPDPAAVTCLVI